MRKLGSRWNGYNKTVASLVITSATWLGVLFVAFVVKHVLADFVLQSEWMARGKEQERGWIFPLAAHAAVHAALTLALVIMIKPSLWWLSLLDFIIHGGIDRSRGLVMRLLKVTEHQAAWWMLFGIDQGLHQFTHFGFILALLLA